MKEMEFKEKLSAAMAEPAAPKKLVEQTVARVQTMLRGREAEERLAGNNEISQAHKVDLLADGLLGRLAQNGALPLGANVAELKNQLMQNRNFCAMSRSSPESLAAGLKNGSIISGLVQPQSHISRPAPSVKKDVPSLGK